MQRYALIRYRRLEIGFFIGLEMRISIGIYARLDSSYIIVVIFFCVATATLE
jgi:hypothetical protein